MAYIVKVCEFCGDTFVTDNGNRRFCCRSCSAQSHHKTAKVGSYDSVTIVVTKHIPVFENMLPKVGVPYRAKRIPMAGIETIYIIPNIGKYGLIIRGNECRESGD